ncbi:hypothetical protein GOV14_03320 [Candidatus Pacearchaeota archaeon]|nr:hypothetical protein [Candidatus Pacearchaeota archaeon]
MLTRILVCEDDVDTAKALCRHIDDIPNHESVMLVKQNSPGFVMDSIVEAIERFSPKYAIIDGLYGSWQTVAKLAVETDPNIIPIILSGDENTVKLAQNAGYTAFSKPSDGDALFKYITDKKR